MLPYRNPNISINTPEEMEKYIRLPFGCELHTFKEGNAKFSGDNTQRIKIVRKNYLPINKILVINNENKTNLVTPEIRLSKSLDGFCIITFSSYIFSEFDMY
jgi:hypothetical protein